MFSVTGLEFSFTEAPESMKSVLQASWLLAVAIGNIIVVIVAKVHFFQAQSYEFLLFFAFMCVDVVLFMYLANNFIYRKDFEAQNADIEKKASSTYEGASTMPMGISNKSK